MPRSAGKPWTSAEISKIRMMAKRRLAAKAIASKLGRSVSAMRRKALSKGIKLQTTTLTTTTRRRKRR